MLASYCRAFVKKKGRNNVTVDELVHVITPKGRGIEILFLRLVHIFLRVDNSQVVELA